MMHTHMHRFCEAPPPPPPVPNLPTSMKGRFNFDVDFSSMARGPGRRGERRDGGLKLCAPFPFCADALFFPCAFLTNCAWWGMGIWAKCRLPKWHFLSTSITLANKPSQYGWNPVKPVSPAMGRWCIRPATLFAVRFRPWSNLQSGAIADFTWHRSTLTATALARVPPASLALRFYLCLPYPLGSGSLYPPHHPFASKTSYHLYRPLLHAKWRTSIIAINLDQLVSPFLRSARFSQP